MQYKSIATVSHLDIYEGNMLSTQFLAFFRDYNLSWANLLRGQCSIKNHRKIMCHTKDIKKILVTSTWNTRNREIATDSGILLTSVCNKNLLPMIKYDCFFYDYQNNIIGSYNKDNLLFCKLSLGE